MWFFNTLFKFGDSNFFAAILAYRRTTDYFYAYYVLKTLTAMVSEGSVNCLALAYLVKLSLIIFIT